MGDPKKAKKKYSTPSHPWRRNEIEENKTLKQEYGLKNRKEILIAISFLKKYKDIAKTLIADKTAQGEKEKLQMMEKLQRYGLLPSGAGLDDVLSIQLKDILARRIQSVAVRKGLARTMNQARQFIVHRHLVIGQKEITSPSYLLTTAEEALLGFKTKSTLSKEDHPERMSQAQIVQKEKDDVAGKKIADEKREKKKKENKFRGQGQKRKTNNNQRTFKKKEVKKGNKP